MQRVIVGSKNAAKVRAVELGVRAYWPQAVVEGFEVESGVGAQPLGHEETLQGALNRARAAQKLGGELGFGLEGGVVEIHNVPIMMSYVAVTDGRREIAVPVTGTPLPRAWGEALKNGAELRPFVVEAGLPYDYKGGVIGTLTNGLLTRDEMFAFAVKTALVPWVNPSPYE
jgi:inosine/xanthosine triphosphatase